MTEQRKLKLIQLRDRIEAAHAFLEIAQRRVRDAERAYVQELLSLSDDELDDLARS